MKISKKQNEVVELINSRQKDIILLIGVLGSSKTFLQSLIAHSINMQYPNSVGGFAKKNMTDINTGTIFDILEAANTMGIDSIRQYGQPLNYLVYKNNNSRLQFHELDHTKDRNFNKTKKLQLTYNMIDELDSITREAFWAAHGRVGRRNNCVVCGATPRDIEQGKACTTTSHMCPPAFSLASCNPNNAWVKEDFYDPWKRGELPDNVAVIEFTQDDSFLGRSYYEKYKNSPPNYRKRYLENNWDYSDDEQSLFKYIYMDAAGRDNRDRNNDRIASLDVALSGVDRAVATLWEGRMIVDIEILKDKDEKIKTEKLGEKFKQWCIDRGVGYENTDVDGVGNGEGVCDWLDDNWGQVNRFKAGSSVDGNYDNLRSMVSHKLALGFENGLVTYLNSCPHISDFKKEATSIAYEETASNLKLERKEKAKSRIGSSPDVFDSVMMGYRRLASSDELTLDDIFM